ncbi:MAG: citramalate synthase [Anaerolineales bacterium]|nr:citramalate synthase [Anaerolineales bacterium]
MIEIYDTTLRDGSQREGISLSCDDKLKIARKLDDLGVAYIEGGWPGSNAKDMEFFAKAKALRWRTARIAAFGSTCRAGSKPGNDENIQAMLRAEAPVCTVVGKSWSLHVTDVLRTSKENNLRMIEESVAFLKAQVEQVFFDAEHFFDGYKADPAYALETLQAARRGGADVLVLCETNGGAMPWELEAAFQAVRQAVPGRLGIHAHNDGECGVANSLLAVRQGATHVQGTINGYGERCGNANLCSIIPDIELKLGRPCLPKGRLRRLYETAHFVAEIANLSPDEYLPYVGKSAFAHKGGIHVSGMRRNTLAYQHVEPALVGNEMRVVVSELSGKGNLLQKLEEYHLEADEKAVAKVLKEIKDLEARGFSFETADASVAMMLKRHQSDYKPPFELIDFFCLVEHRQGRGLMAEANVKIRVGQEVMHTAAEGNGPVNALDGALRKALQPRYPQIRRFELTDYKVRILDSTSGTGAVVRVLIDTQSDGRRWSTVGASENIIEASWRALSDAVEFGLTMK